MSFLRSRFTQAVLVLVLAFVILRFGIRPPAPRSVLSLYMFIITLAVLVPSNARRPVAISYSVAPSAQMSLRASASRPSSCSGAM